MFMISENDLQAGDILGGFKIERVLGRGGMGVVFKAHELSLNRKIALKVLASRLSTSNEFLQRFKREAQVIASLKHPNIVNILSYGQDQGLHYFAMEYVQGKDLREIMQDKPLLAFDEALRIVRQVADALSEAGAKGVVHRDIKPSNIMIDPMGRAFVTDFGVACIQESSEKLTQTGLFLGTPEYASPEQAKGLALDVRSDIYSLGAVLYRMVSGRPPVSGESPLAVVVKISTEPVTPIEQVNPAVPKPICDLIAKMMAKEAGNRYQSPKALLEDVDRCIHLLSGQIEGSPAVEDPFDDAAVRRAVAKPRRNIVGILGGVLGMALAVVLLVWLVEGRDWFGNNSAPAVEKSALEKGAAGDSASSADSNSAQVKMAAPQEGSAAPDSSPESGAPPSPPQEVPSAASASQPPPASVSAGKAAKEAVAAGASGRDRDAPAGASPLVAVATPPPAGSGREKAPAVKTQMIQPNRLPMLPKNPVVLVIASGEESMLALTRSYLYTHLRSSGLKILTFAEIPVLREKMQMGDMPISWYEIKEIAPPGQAQVLVLAEIIKTGSMPIQYMGRTDELIHAAFTLQAMDMETGESIHSGSSDTIKFTAMNMDQKLKEGISSATRGIGGEIKGYWEGRLGR